MTSRLSILLLFLSLSLGLNSCYSLKGISISSETKTYFVAPFIVESVDAPGGIGQEFGELLKNTINSETRLSFDESNPNVAFSGSITNFSINAEAPNPNNTSDLSRLNISVNVVYTDNLTPKNSYRQTFSDYETFDANVNLYDIQEQLIETIFKRINEEAFNKAFSNW